jgi:hypothetical protein
MALSSHSMASLKRDSLLRSRLACAERPLRHLPGPTERPPSCKDLPGCEGAGWCHSKTEHHPGQLEDGLRITLRPEKQVPTLALLLAPSNRGCKPGGGVATCARAHLSSTGTFATFRHLAVPATYYSVRLLEDEIDIDSSTSTRARVREGLHFVHS